MQKLTKEDFEAFLIFDFGYSLLLLIAAFNGFWESFFGGLAGGAFVNLVIFREYYLQKQKKSSE